MGLLKLFSKSASAAKVDRLPTGSLVINRAGTLIASTLPVGFPKTVQEQIGRAVLQTFAASRKGLVPLSELVMQFNGLKLVAHELRGGAMVFLHPSIAHKKNVTLFNMSNPALDEFILYLETYIECWKQFNHYVNLARTEKFTNEDETQFLEVKSLITQGLEVILAAVEQAGPRKDEVMSLINNAHSLRHLTEHPNSIPMVESQWHKAFLSMQSLLGRLKVHQQKQVGEWTWGSLFGREK